jgi:hypothetical protein
MNIHQNQSLSAESRLLTVDEQVGVQEAGINTMGPGQEAALLQRRVDLGGGRALGRWADGGFEVGHQVRQLIGTGFRAVHGVADPWRGVLARIVGVGVVG